MHIATSKEFRQTSNLSPMLPFFRLRKNDKENAFVIVPKQETVFEIGSPIARIFFISHSPALAVSDDAGTLRV